MPNQLTSQGLVTKTYEEILTELEARFRQIYGNDINLDSDTPDGQMIGIFAQAAKDNLDLLAEIYSSFNPDAAIGRTLDERCAINGIKRLGGTFSVTPISVTTDRAVTLAGLDAASEDLDGEGFTVADNANVQWILLDTVSLPGAGTHVLNFRAKEPGAILTTPNTITTPVTVVLGIESVNNPSAQSVVGLDEETDAELRLRRQKSVALSSKGYRDGLLAALLNISGVTSAFVYENNTGATDADGIPSHSIWCIVSGGEDEDIARAIYSKRNAGCGMKGDVTVPIVQADGTVFDVLFDRTETEAAYIKFTLSPITGRTVLNSTYIKEEIVKRYTLGVYETANTNRLATVVQEIEPNALVTNAGLSLIVNGAYTSKLTPSAKDKQLALSAANIEITRNFRFYGTNITATAGATYDLDGVTYTVVTTVANGSSIVLSSTSDANPTGIGTLTKLTGTGDASVDFIASEAA